MGKIVFTKLLRLSPSPSLNLRKAVLLNILRTTAIPAIAGLMMASTLAPLALWPLAWIALTPLWVYSLQAKNWKTAAQAGAAWGIAYHGAALSWIWGLHPLTWLGVPWLGSVAIAGLSWVFVTLWGALVAILFAIGLWWLGQHWKFLSRLLLAITLWCSLEALWDASPLWWTAIANSQSPQNLPVAQLSQLSGPTLLNALLLGVNGCLAEAWMSRRKSWLGLALGMMAIAHLGGWQLSATPTAPPTHPLAIGLVQGNLPSRFKLTPAGQQRSVEHYTMAYRQLVAQGVDAVLMPEGTLPFLWGRFPHLEQPVLETLRTSTVPLWVGTFVPTGDPLGAGKAGRYTQSLVELKDDGSFQTRYNKVKLVPLGEYLPFAEQLKGILQRLSPVELTMEPGTHTQTFFTRFGKATVGICYDSAFPNLFRRQTAAGGEFILSIANNDPFSARMMAQHHALDVLRAIESDRWLVRATNTGLSAVISPKGVTQWQSSPRTESVHIGQIQRRNSRTLYVRLGDWLLPLLWVSSGLLGGLTWRRHLNTLRITGYARESRTP
jgi:apolipoprotein N-acyltransferase